MANDMDFYMSLLEELQSTTTVLNSRIADSEDELAVARDHMISVDWSTRVVKLPPAYLSYLSVATDHRAATVYFEADRFYDNVDLTKMTFAVEYINADKEGFIYPVIDFDLQTSADEGKMIFGWKIGHDITKKAGTIQFMIHAFQVDPATHKYRYSLHTEPCSATILPTLNIDKELGLEDLYGIESQEVEDLFSRLQQLEQKAVVWNDLQGFPD